MEMADLFLDVAGADDSAMALSTTAELGALPVMPGVGEADCPAQIVAEIRRRTDRFLVIIGKSLNSDR